MDYAKPESVTEDLEKLEDEYRLDLLEKIVAVAEAESYNWSMSVHDVIDWLRDIRIKNNLYAIVFIWDEFTEFAINRIVDRDVTINQDDIKNLFPLHPYSSYLLRLISQNISSNQRTMFQFLCADYIVGDEVQTNFRWFINNYFFDNGAWNFLTIDWLWNYFFRMDNSDLEQNFKDAIG